MLQAENNLKNSTQQGHYWDANFRYASYKIRAVLWNPNVVYHAHEMPPQV
jgi:hypothetical protein